MASDAPQFVYREIAPEEIDAIRPLWEKLRAHHTPLSRHFGDELSRHTFEERKQQLLAKAKTKAGTLRIDLVRTTSSETPVAYCVSSISRQKVGEIDSIYVERDLRNHGIGSELMRRVLTWLDELKAVRKVVSVAYVNEAALAFYARFGFLPATLVLRQKRSIE